MSSKIFLGNFSINTIQIDFLTIENIKDTERTDSKFSKIIAIWRLKTFFTASQGLFSGTWFTYAFRISAQN